MTTFTRGVKSKLAALCLAGSIAIFSGGCQTTQRGRQNADFLGNTIASEFIGRIINPNAYPNKQERRNVNVPENVIYRDGKYSPAQDYTWINPNDNNDLRVRQKVEPKLFIYHKWVDLNGDGFCKENEFFGLGKKVFNINKEKLKVAFLNRDYTGTVILKSWNSNGEMIGETKHTFNNCYKTVTWIIGFDTNSSNPLDFLDKIKEAGSGEYKISAHMNGKTFVKDIKIIGD